MAILQIACIRRRGFRIRQTLPAINEILCRDRRAVGPLCIFTQMEGPDFKILVVPFFRNARDRMAVEVAHQQPFKQIAVNIGLRHAFNFVRIERLHFGAIVTYQRLFVRQLYPCRYICRNGGVDGH